MLSTPQLGQFYHKMKGKHGKIFRLKLGVRNYMVVVADLAAAEAVIQNEGKYPSRGVTLKAMNLIQEEYRTSVGLPAADLAGA